MVADALIYHPTVSHYLKFVATTGTVSLYLPLSHPSYSQLLHAFLLLLLAHPHFYEPTNVPQSAATKSSAPSNTSRASSPGISTAQTMRNPASRPSRRPRNNSASRAS
jgi:hypothetical protein